MSAHEGHVEHDEHQGHGEHRGHGGHEGHGGPEGFYLRNGLEPTGEVRDGEIVARRVL